VQAGGGDASQPRVSYANKGPLESPRASHGVERKRSIPSSKTHQRPPALTDLSFRLHQRHSKATSPLGDGEGHSAAPYENGRRGITPQDKSGQEMLLRQL